MTSTRRASPIDIHQDPDASFDHKSEQDVETALLNALRPLGDAPNKHNVQLKPTTTTTTRPASSPHKTDSSPLRPISARGLTNVRISPPPGPHFTTDSPRKRAEFYQMYHEAVPDKARFSNFSSTDPFDHENTSGVPDTQYAALGHAYKGPMKRGLPDSAPPKDRSVKKPKTDKDEHFELPNPRDMPSLTDDGSKPPHSYAELIGMAILRASTRRLTLAQIYKWISDNFAFYRLAESGWQNSIRHNLSLNKNFVKQERPKDDPGKGNYWAIKPGEERPYLMGKKNPVRRVNPDGSSYMHGLPSDVGSFRSSSVPAISQFSLAPSTGKKFEPKAIDSAKFPDEADLSSDGTIPASDPALQEDEIAEANTLLMPPPLGHLRSSPPPQEIGSSPPQMLAPPALRRGTPPPVPRFPSTSRSGGRRRKFGGMHDSGYWSSIESSAARVAAHQLTSEADMTRTRPGKKGRAEAEIKRMRSSSFDSPSDDKLLSRPSVLHFVSSSPLKDDDHPLTPAVVFKRPAKPPPSISPNTNLRNHRDRMRALLGSPPKTFSPLPETTSWSPAFNLAEDRSVGLTPHISPYKPSKTPWKAINDSCDNSAIRNYNAAFDIFIDAPEEDLQARGSPEKRTRRPSLARAATSAGILADITGTSKSNNIALTPATGSPFSLSPLFAKSSSLRSPARLGSPLKQSETYLQASQEDDMKWLEGLDAENHLTRHADLDAHDTAGLFGTIELPSDGSEEAIDIFQDFGKIGQHQAHPNLDRSTGSPIKRSSNMGPPARPAPRPHLGRSNTSRW